MAIEQRPDKSPMSVVGVGVTVLVGVVAVIVAFQVLSAVVGVLFFVVKVAVVIAIVALVAKFFLWKKR